VQSEWHDNMNDVKNSKFDEICASGPLTGVRLYLKSLISTGSITNRSKSLSQSLSSAAFWIATTHSAIFAQPFPASASRCE